MPLWNLAVLVILFFITSVIGVVTGSNSLITVPLMFQFGIDEKVAVATNMFGLTFMAVGGTIPFMRRGSIDLRGLSPLVVLTIIGSAVGALLVGLISNDAIRLIVLVAMIVIVIFTLLRGGGRGKANETLELADGTVDNDVREPSAGMSVKRVALFVATFLLAIYGGLYSGGYVTVLTVSLVAFSGMSFSDSIAATKFLNVFSSGIATLVFMWQGLVDYRLGIILAIAMFAGAYIGAHYAAKMDETWLRRIFLSVVFILAIKTLIDFF